MSEDPCQTTPRMAEAHRPVVDSKMQRAILRETGAKKFAEWKLARKQNLLSATASPVPPSSASTPHADRRSRPNNALAGMGIHENAELHLRMASMAQRLAGAMPERTVQVGNGPHSPAQNQHSMASQVTPRTPTVSHNRLETGTSSAYASKSNAAMAGRDTSGVEEVLAASLSHAAPCSPASVQAHAASAHVAHEVGLGVTGTEARDPMVDMLLMQVESLMREKAGLCQENAALRRENEQLQELVGYLSCGANEEDGQWALV